MFAGLPNEVFALMKRIKEVPAFISTMISSTGFKPTAGMADLVSRACFSLRMVLVIIPAQTVGGTAVPFTVRFSRAVSLNDADSRLELQGHSISGKDHSIPLL